jgi:hypothetical protein
MALHLPSPNGSLLDTHPSGGWRCTCRLPSPNGSLLATHPSGAGMALHLPSPNGSLLDTHPSGGWCCTCRRPMARCSTHILQGDGAAPAVAHWLAARHTSFRGMALHLPSPNGSLLDTHIDKITACEGMRFHPTCQLLVAHFLASFADARRFVVIVIISAIAALLVK